MNPFKLTLVTLVAWIILTIICVFSVEDVSEKPFAVAVFSYYLAPFVCMVTFIVSSFFYRCWVKNHKIVVAIIMTVLILWALHIIFYIQSL